MKTIILLTLLSITCCSLQAQDEPLLGKKGQAILPQKGDIGLGINLIPFLYWAGNSFNGNANNTYAIEDKFFSIFGNSVLIGKYMLTDKTALRLAWGVNFGHSTKDQYVQDDALNDPNALVKDSRTLNWSRASVAVGYEMRRGKGRLQGFWGADLRVRYNKDNDYIYTYGNGYSLTNLVSTSYNWGSNLNANKRTITHTGANVWGLGLRGFLGAEYFIAPKFCIGAEFGWGVTYQHSLAVTVTEEYYDVNTQAIGIDKNYIAATNTVSAGVDNFDGTIYLMFFFNQGNGTVAKTGSKGGNKKVSSNKNKTEKKGNRGVSGNSRF